MILCFKSLTNERPSIIHSIVTSVLLWFFAFLLGLQLSFVRSAGFSSLIGIAVCQPISIIALLCCHYIPLFLAVIAAVRHWAVLVNCICFLKAFSYGFTVLLVYLHFHTAGWLIRFLFLFSDTVVCSLLLCLTIISRRAEHSGAYRFFCLYGFLTVVFDYIYISPLLRGLF